MSKLNLTWQYNGCAPWIDILFWCNTNLGEWSYNHKFETIFFYTEADETMFLLRWA